MFGKMGIGLFPLHFNFQNRVLAIAIGSIGKVLLELSNELLTQAAHPLKTLNSPISVKPFHHPRLKS